MHREELVVDVLGNDAAIGRQLGAHDQREHAAGDEERERDDAEVERDALVVGRGEAARGRRMQSGCDDAHTPVPWLASQVLEPCGRDGIDREVHLRVKLAAVDRALPA